MEVVARRLATTEQLRSIVRTMRSLAAASIHQYEAAAATLEQYRRTIEQGLQVVLRRGRGRIRTPPAEASVVVVAFGSDRGLCGRLNEAVASFAIRQVPAGPRPHAADALIAIGGRVAAQLEQRGRPAAREVRLPGSAGGIPRMANELVLVLDEWARAAPIGRVVAVYPERQSRGVVAPVAIPLLPVDVRRLRRLAARPWRSRSLPTFSLAAERLEALLLRQLLFVSICRAAAASLASEHSARLAAMHVAERNIGDHLEELMGEHHRLRQESITAELMDVVAGFEAVRDR